MDRVVKPGRRAAASVLSAAALLLTMGDASAQSADPTLPPPGLMALPEGAQAPSVSTGPELQSILVSREAGGRRVAVIGGEMVRQGGRYQGAVVEKVGDNEVILRRGKAREVLRLYPKQPGQRAEHQ